MLTPEYRNCTFQHPPCSGCHIHCSHWYSIRCSNCNHCLHHRMCTVSLSAENCIGLLIVNHRFLRGSTAVSSCSNSQYCLIVCGLVLQATIVVCVLHAVVAWSASPQPTTAWRTHTTMVAWSASPQPTTAWRTHTTMVAWRASSQTIKQYWELLQEDAAVLPQRNDD